MPPRRKVPETTSEAQMARPQGMKYAHLHKDGQLDLLRQRLAQLEQEHYNHETNKLVLEAQPESDQRDVAIAQTDLALVALESAHSIIAAELKAQGG